VDVYDALSHDRPYRKAWDTQKVLEYIKSESGKHFDPEVVNVFFGEIVKDENRNPAC
jgi:HD-GYP domain-containing protein (c-di-GMP phosphodiesterase class II)